ncbi:hypothetical protein CSKR_201434, partial [Clonorchis sinensis]
MSDLQSSHPSKIYSLCKLAFSGCSTASLETEDEELTQLVLPYLYTFYMTRSTEDVSG